jgi:hypothetical protein
LLSGFEIECLTDTHEHTPEDDETNNRGAGTGAHEGLGERSNDDEDQLKTVHLLAANNVGEGSESDLTEDSSCGGRELDGGVLRGRQSAALVVDDTQHDGQERHAEDVVAVREETSAGHENGADVVPSKRRLSRVSGVQAH